MNFQLGNINNKQFIQSNSLNNLPSQSDVEIQLDFAMGLKKANLYSAAFEIFESLADKHNNPRAQYEVGKIYYMGHGNVTANPAVAFNFFQRAADQGHAGAQNQLGLMYEKGHGNEACIRLLPATCSRDPD